jgi:protein phosphatase PTC7
LMMMMTTMSATTTRGATTPRRALATMRSVCARERVVVARASGELALCAVGENRPHPDKVAKGGEDAWFVVVDAERGNGTLCVADGVGGFNEQGVDPGLYARVLSYEGLAAATRDGGDDDPRRVAIEAQTNTKLPGAATMCVVRLSGSTLTCANVGDSGFRVVRDGAVVYGSTAGQHYFNCPYQLQYRDLAKECDVAEDADVFSFDVREGDIVVAGSDGLFDNVFDEEIASVATAAYAAADDAAGGARAAAKALVEVARGHAGDKSYDSPYAREMAKSDTDKGGAPKAVGLFGGFQQMMGGASAGVGGKMDDITVIVSGVVSTAAAREALEDAQAFAALNTKALTKARGLASVEETKVARTVALRKEMDAAFNEKVAEVKAKEKAIADADPEFTRAQIDAMDAPTVRKLLQERGLPTSGKLERLKDRLAQVKAL